MSRSKVLEQFNTAVALQEPDEVPVCIWSVAIWYLTKHGISVKEYYQGKELKLKAQMACQDDYPDAILLPGIWPDFGVVAEPSAFGCPVIWEEGEAPQARPMLTDPSQILSIKPVDVKNAGLFPKVIETYEYFFEHLPQRYIDEYGYLDGMVFFLGPLETAALIRGYVNFLMDLIKNPCLVHKLLDIITDTLLEWIKYLESNVIGKVKRLMLCDHFPTQISIDHFEEFVFPYFKRIFDEYPDALKLYHNEGEVMRIIERIPDMGTSLFHFGTKAKQTKEKIGDRVCLMGNLDPVGLLQDGTPERVTEEALRVLEVSAPGGGFVLAAAGAYGIDASDANIRALLDSVKIYAEQRNRLPLPKL